MEGYTRGKQFFKDNHLRAIYTLGIIIYGFIIRLASFFNPKAKQWADGRKSILKDIERQLKPYAGKTLWMHSASLGEFEQGRSILEALREKQANIRIILTFFSPSGYEIRKDTPLADYVFYLPEDTPSNARKFLALVEPDIAVFIKYEYWYNYLKVMDSQKMPVLFISAIFRPQQHFFQFYGVWFRKHLRQIQHFFVQNEISQELLRKIGVEQVSISGDTRFDRVLSIAENVVPNALVKAFKQNHELFLAGSSWPKDESCIQPMQEFFPELKIIVAPHIINEAHIVQIENLFINAVRYSRASLKDISSYQVLIIDNMGMLSSLYQYANYAFIGGGFGVGIHNTLEAATFGMPIFIGPNYHKFQEAKDLVEDGVAIVIHEDKQLLEEFSNLKANKQEYHRIVEASRKYVQSGAGATKQIVNSIEDILF